MATLADVLEARTAEAAPELVEPISKDRLRCYACGHECPIPDGAVGVCKVRFNRGGHLLVPWGYVGGVQCDPIEKKPFFHAHPGALAFSFGMLGCDLHCSYCQNWVTSQALRDPQAVAPPTRRVARRRSSTRRCGSARSVVVSTYNEPLITSEWAVAIFKEARAAGLMTAYVSNGNGTPRVLEYIRPWVDLYKVDLKSFDDRHYRQLGGRIEPILYTIRALHEMGIWLEIVTLLIPGFNDSDDELERLTVVPGRRLARHPVARDRVPQGLPDERSGEHDARDAGAGGRDRRIAMGCATSMRATCPGASAICENTRCHHCRALLVERYGYFIQQYRVTADGTCPDCGTKIPGRWGRQFAGQIASTPFLPGTRRLRTL